MKIAFLSDIHGSVTWLNRALEFVDRHNVDALAILGDTLYHGPRNPLPEGYDPKACATILNDRKNEIIAVRGNCDSEVDQMLLEFPIMADFSWILVDGVRLHLAHGHHHWPDRLPPLCAGDAYVFGHTHIPLAEKRGDVFVCNPGSICLPKDEHPHSMAFYENKTFTIRDLDGNIVDSVKLE